MRDLEALTVNEAQRLAAAIEGPPRCGPESQQQVMLRRLAAELLRRQAEHIALLEAKLAKTRPQPLSTVPVLFCGSHSCSGEGRALVEFDHVAAALRDRDARLAQAARPRRLSEDVVQQLLALTVDVAETHAACMQGLDQQKAAAFEAATTALERALRDLEV